MTPYSPRQPSAPRQAGDDHEIHDSPTSHEPRFTAIDGISWRRMRYCTWSLGRFAVTTPETASPLPRVSPLWLLKKHTPPFHGDHVNAPHPLRSAQSPQQSSADAPGAEPTSWPTKSTPRSSAHWSDGGARCTVPDLTPRLHLVLPLERLRKHVPPFHDDHVNARHAPLLWHLSQHSPTSAARSVARSLPS
ncbi:hypothetical protein P43SY_011665 [Pythium insidiosum]|uniref:Uncharacterized protein n=1 Tax=Pythium insidiosum TaxID=114742 RepID=A0AAD5Q0U4_PYTIN|nr:hypothetical protein P43SY_011665 [Pythium insidiosum]